MSTQAWATAGSGVHGTLVEYARHLLLADDRPEEIAADLRRFGGLAFALLEHGLADFGRTPSA